MSLLRYWDSPLVSDLVRSEVVAAVTNVSLFYSESGALDSLSFVISDPSGWLGPSSIGRELLIISEPPRMAGTPAVLVREPPGWLACCRVSHR